MQGYGRQGYMPQGYGRGAVFQPGEDEDEFDEQYDSEGYYDEEALQSDDSELIREQYAQQLAIKQAQEKAKMSQQYTGPGSKPIGSMLYGGASAAGPMGGGIGAMGSVGAMGAMGGGTQFGGGAIGGGGGFTYGSASGAGGMIFGAASAAGPMGGAGAKPQQKPFGLGAQAANTKAPAASAGYQFGGASQFGGMGAGSSSIFGAGQAAAPSNDPYANIDIDLTKIKQAVKPSKAFEEKTDEEKAATVLTRANSNVKSNLKNVGGDSDTAAKKKEVKWGKSTTYQVDKGADSEGDYNNDGIDKERGSPRPNKKIIGEQDLSDGRDEKEKIKEQLEQEEKQALDQLRKMEAWKKAQTAKDEAEESGAFNQSKLDQARLKAQIEESVGSSSMSTAQKLKRVEESYSSDPFEDVSVSGSGSKEVNNIWTKNKIATVVRTVTESSDRYEDEEFDSMSKSKSDTLLDSKKDSGRGQANKFKSKLGAPIEHKSILSTYVKKENKGTMTDVGKYSYMSATDAQPANVKEWSLKRNLEDAELLIQELKARQADDKEEYRALEIKLKQKDMEYQQARREALGSNETVKRLQDQVKDFVHKQNLFSIESEQLIKQIDMADAKTREKEDELVLARAEYDRKLKLVEERILYKRDVDSDRKVLDLKHEHQVELSNNKVKQSELQEQIDYLNEKVNKLLTENKSIRITKDGAVELKKLEDENAMLREQASKVSHTSGGEKGVKLDDSMIIEGMSRENEKAEAKIRELTDRLKKKEKEIIEEKKRSHELQLLQMKNKNRVFVETQEDEIDIQTANVMGTSNAISEKGLRELHEMVRQLRQDNDDYKRDWALKETQLKSQIQKIRDEKTQAEKHLYDAEYVIGEKTNEIVIVKDTNLKERKLSEQQIKDLEDKVKWFRENQRILSDQQQELSSQNAELGQLRQQMKKAEESGKIIRELERKCRIYEETIKSKNPNSIAMLIQASKDAKPMSEEEEQSKKQLQFRIKQLEGEIDTNDKDFERRLRALRQEQERMKQIYEERSANPAEAVKVNELEKELQRTKDYYHKRIRELEDKYKFNAGPKDESKVKQLTSKPDKKKVAGKAEVETKIVSDVQKEAILAKQIEELISQKDRMAKQLQDALQANSINIVNKPKQDATPGKPSALNEEKVEATQPKRNPFFIEEEQTGPKTTAQLLDTIAKSKVNLKQFEGQSLRMNKLHQAFQGVLSVPELKQIQNFLASQRNPDDAEIDGQDDYIDMDDLINAALIGHKQGQDKNYDTRRIETPHDEEELRRKVKRILREKDDDCEFYNAKIRQLKRQLKDAQAEKSEIEEANQRVEAQKQRMEKFYKTKMGLDDVGKGTTGDLFTEMSVMQRRLEFLEEQAEERNKQALNEHAPCRREIGRLEQELVEEREIRSNCINKKNKEIAYFKNELDGLLTEIASTSTDSH